MRRPFQIAVGLIALCQSPAAAQQPVGSNSSHASLGASTVMAEPLAGRSDRDILNGLMANPEMLRKFAEALRANDGSPESLKKIEEFQKLYPELADPQRLRSLSEEAKRSAGGFVPSMGPKATSAGEKAKGYLENLKGKIPFFPPAKESDKARSSPPFPPRHNSPPPTPPTSAPSKRTFAKALKNDPKLARWLRENLGDRPEFEEMLKDINLSAASNDWQRSDWFRSLQSEAVDLGHWIGQQDLKLPQIGWNTRGFNPPRLNVPTGSLEIGRPAVPSAAGAGSVTTILVAVLAVLAVVWFRMGRGKKAIPNVRGADTGLGNLAFDPHAVRSGSELVAAYDKLGIRSLGEAARHWNHKTVSREMNLWRPSETYAIAELTRLYEKARYSAAEATLNEVELADARRHLAGLLERETR